MDKTNMTDQELDKILQATAQPALPKDFAARLQARLEVGAPGNVIPFPARNKNPALNHRLWLSAIPLVASLAAGLYIGAIGDIPASLAAITPTSVSDASDQILGSGFEDTEAFVNGDLS